MKKVLVIDDDTAITDLLSMLLKISDFDPIVSNSGKEGIQLARDCAPDVVILDLMMPDVNGWDVCKAIRSFSSVPIVTLSAINDPEMIASILDAGADDFLVKPVPSGVLVAHLKKLTRRTGSLSPSNGLMGAPKTDPFPSS